MSSRIARRSSAERWYRFTFWTVSITCAAAVAAYGATDPWVAAPLACVLLAAAAALCIHRTVAGQPLPWHPVLWLALAFALLVVAQLCSGHTINGGATRTALAQLAGPGAALYLSLFAFRRPELLRTLAWAAWGFTLVLAGEAIVQAYSAGGYIYWHRDATYATPAGPYVYHNHFAGCMDLLLPLAMAAVFLRRRDGRAKQRSQQWLEGVSPALGVAAVVVAASRGGLLTLAVEAMLGLVLTWRAGKLRWGGALLTAGGGTAIALASNWQPLMSRFFNLTHGDVSATDRIYILRSCLSIWRAHPWWGAGFGTFASAYPQHQVADLGKTVLAAHNDYAQALAETGLLGALVIVAFLAVWAWTCFAGRASGAERLVRRAALIAALGFLFHSAMDFEFHSPANALLFFLVAGAAASGTTVYRAAAPPGKAPRRYDAAPSARLSG